MPRSGLETACTGIPAASSPETTSFQPELSANAPWTSTTVGAEAVVACVMSSPLVAHHPAGARWREATVVLPVPRRIGHPTTAAGRTASAPRAVTEGLRRA